MKRRRDVELRSMFERRMPYLPQRWNVVSVEVGLKQGEVRAQIIGFLPQHRELCLTGVEFAQHVAEHLEREVVQPVMVSCCRPLGEASSSQDETGSLDEIFGERACVVGEENSRRVEVGKRGRREVDEDGSLSCRDRKPAVGLGEGHNPPPSQPCKHYSHAARWRGNQQSAEYHIWPQPCFPPTRTRRMLHHQQPTFPCGTIMSIRHRRFRKMLQPAISRSNLKEERPSDSQRQ